MEMMYDVFISYSRKNMDLADMVESSFKSRGLRCFLDRETIEIGEDFATKIAKSIYQSEVVLLLWTPESNQSDNVAKEIALADAYSKTIIPFQVGNFIPHYRLAYMLALLNRADKQQGFSENELEKLTDWVIRSILNSRERRELSETAVQAEDKGSVTEKMEFQLERLAEQVKTEVPVNYTADCYEQEYLLGCEKFRQYDLDQAFELLLEPALEDYKDARMYLSYCISTDLRIRKVAEYRFEDLRSREDELKDNGFALYILAVDAAKLLFDNAAAYSYAVRSMEAGSDYGTLFYVYCHEFGWGVDRNFKKVAPVLRRLALKGNAGAQSWYGKHLLYGWSGSKDLPLALRFIREGADKGDMNCLYTLADVYCDGVGVEKDFAKAEDLCLRLIDMGYAEAYMQLGRMYCYNNGDSSILKDPESFRKGFSYLMKGAELGEPECMYELARLYYLGHNGEHNIKLAMKWYNRAAEAGLRSAYFTLGCLYYGEEHAVKLGITIDYQKAWDYFQKGAELRSWDSYFLMAFMYYEGVAPKDVAALDAIRYLQEAVFGGGIFAGEAAGRLYDIYHEGKDVPRDEFKAIDYLKKAAEYGDVEAMVKLGKILTTDVASPYADEILGFKYLAQAYEQGSVEAAIALARLSISGVGTLRNREKAKEYLQFAIDKEENPEALCEMGKIFYQTCQFSWTISYKDESVPEAQRETEKMIGIEYLKKAAEKQYAEAYLWLGEAARDRMEGCDAGSLEYEEGLKEYIGYTKKGADLNHHQCLLDLGIYYAYGFYGIEKDEQKSSAFLLKAMSARSIQAYKATLGIWRDRLGSGDFPIRMSEVYNEMLFADEHWEPLKEQMNDFFRISEECAAKLEKDIDFDVVKFADCALPRKMMLPANSSIRLGLFDMRRLEHIMSKIREASGNLQGFLDISNVSLQSHELHVIEYVDTLRSLISASWKKLRSEVSELSEVTFFDHNKILEIADGLADDLHKIQLNSTVELYLKLEEFYKEINRQLTIKLDQMKK